jgi:hypothetical protein
MNQSDVQYATDKLAQLKSEYMVDIFQDWGDNSGTWQSGYWTVTELDQLHNILDCFGSCIGGPKKLGECTGGVTVRKAEIGTHGGEADVHMVRFSTNTPLSAWTVVHEFAHAWDANHHWKLSKALEKYTGGFTSLVFSWLVKNFGKPDLLDRKFERTLGHYGRKPGCNAFGYFYGDKPGGSDWNFNRREDFAECVAMYVGWERGNDLSDHARNRIIRFELNDGEKDGFGVADNWQYYRKYFYPENGDYTKTKRWQFIDDLIKGNIQVT